MCSLDIYGHTKNNTTESFLGNVKIHKKNAIMCYKILMYIKIKHLWLHSFTLFYYRKTKEIHKWEQDLQVVDST